MNIDISKFKCYWWEDFDCNVIESETATPPNNARTYHHCFPCEITEQIDSYDYHPKGIDRLLIKIPLLKNKVQKRIGKTFKHVCSINTSLGYYSQKTVVAMVNSGDYTLEQALWVVANACERCSNVLDRKYLGKEYGYEEYSNEWKKCNTVCDFCRSNEIGEEE